MSEATGEPVVESEALKLQHGGVAGETEVEWDEAIGLAASRLAAVERLRKSKQENDSEDRKAGFKAGHEWACEEAEARELERLAKMTGCCSRNGLHDALSDGEQEIAAVVLHKMIFGDENCISCIGGFWQGVAGMESPSGSFLCGFADGAIAVWDAVEAKL